MGAPGAFQATATSLGGFDQPSDRMTCWLMQGSPSAAQAAPEFTDPVSKPHKGMLTEAIAALYF